jgi:hypothetical protein
MLDSTPDRTRRVAHLPDELLDPGLLSGADEHARQQPDRHAVPRGGTMGFLRRAAGPPVADTRSLGTEGVEMIAHDLIRHAPRRRTGLVAWASSLARKGWLRELATLMSAHFISGQQSRPRDSPVAGPHSL